MCGIFVSGHQTTRTDVSHVCRLTEEVDLSLREANGKRGPDAQNDHILRFPSGSDCRSLEDSLEVVFFASELRLRGECPVVQPHVQSCNVLCWNGEIFEGLEISERENDGSRLFAELCKSETSQAIVDLLARIEGPYALVFYHDKLQRLYYARDPLGRRSLLLHEPTVDHPYFVLCSVASPHSTQLSLDEVSTSSIFCIDPSKIQLASEPHKSWKRALSSLNRKPSDPLDSCFVAISRLNTTIPPDDSPLIQSLDFIPDYISQTVDDFTRKLDRIVHLQVRDIPRGSLTESQPRVAVLFSGGIDSTILTFLAHRHIPLTEPIDLLNVAFENPRKIRVQKEGNFGGVSRRRKKVQVSQVDYKDGKKDGGETNFMVPDRVTGLIELEELRRLCPGRIFNFVEVNVPFVERQAARSTVETLMIPGRTVMDLSLAMALYFASRGSGQVRDSSGLAEPYATPARVLLNGLGSDELLGGYRRHRKAFGTGSWASVISELQEEIDRIPARNLGRDDRVISSHGKETRHPFLSLTLVNFVAQLPIHLKMDPRLVPGFGDKMLLRLVCRKLGLVEASSREKRAMQFGSHSARMEGESRGDIELDT